MYEQPRFTHHAAQRSRTRGIPTQAVTAAVAFGRHRVARGADIYIVGWREVRLQARHGLDLSRWQGVQVVCAHDGTVLTVYRNKLPRALRDREIRRAA